MREELLDDELPIDEVDQYYLSFIQQALPVLKLTAFVLIAYGVVSMLQTVVYVFFEGQFVSGSSYFSRFLWVLSDVVMFLAGYKLWKKHQDLQELDKQGFEENQFIWINHTKHVWQLLALVELINIVHWFID